MKCIGSRAQRTIAAPVGMTGRGFITGVEVRLRFLPAPPDSGLVFVRVDRPGRPCIPALAENVTDTRRRTTLGSGPDSVTLAEHVLSALSALKIDNCLIEIDGPEPPGLDGSAFGFVRTLWPAGVVRQSAMRPVWTVEEPLLVRREGSCLALHPHADPSEKGLRISYVLDYGAGSPIPPQTRTCKLTTRSFCQDLANCRTFLLEREAEALQAEGVGRHLTPGELLVFGSTGPIDNSLRFGDEPCRHKILDVVGDLALCGADLAGHVVAYRSGHPLNVELARSLVAEARGISPRPSVAAA